MGADHSHDDDLLTPLEQHIVELIEELESAIVGLSGDDDEQFPLTEFDQRLLLEHAQIIQRYILAQAAARAYPRRYRLIGSASPRADSVSGGVGDKGEGYTRASQTDDAHMRPDHDHVDHGHDDQGHDDATHRHYVADPAAAREAHRQGRAIIGEHPWEHDHEHSDGHDHADEWAWEPLGDAPPPA